MDGPPYIAKEPLVPPLPSLSNGPNTTPPFCGFKLLSLSMKSGSGNDLTACAAAAFPCPIKRTGKITNATMQVGLPMKINVAFRSDLLELYRLCTGKPEQRNGRPKSQFCV